MRERSGGNDPGRVVRDLAVMLADGGYALTDPTYRVIERIASDPELFEGLRRAGRRRASTPGDSAWGRSG